MPELIIPLIAFALILSLTLTVLIRTMNYKAERKEVASCEPIEVDSESAVRNLSDMIRIKTVSSVNKSEEDEGAFEEFRALLSERYPALYSKALVEYPTDRSILIRIKGESEDAVSVLMAHYDVVSVNESDWQKPPFGGVIEDGAVWGRGALDTKCSLLGALEASESLIRQGFIPKNDIYLAFGGDEEVGGYGARSIVKLFKDRGIVPALVLDEGGAVVENVFPGVKGQCALIGIAEKGMLNVEYKASGGGGHASAPIPNAPVGKLSRACLQVEGSAFKFRVSDPARLMLDTLARHSSFVYRMIFANLWLFAPILDLITRRSGGELNALLRTTTAFTVMEGSKGLNVIPTKARMTSNHRIIPGETVETTLHRIRKNVRDKSVEISVIDGMDPSRVSSVDSSAFALIEETATECWQGVITSPYLMIACSDSRHWGEITDRVYRFSPMALSKEERATIHSGNERIPIATVTKVVEFYSRLISKL